MNVAHPVAVDVQQGERGLAAGRRRETTLQIHRSQISLNLIELVDGAMSVSWIHLPSIEFEPSVR